MFIKTPGTRRTRKIAGKADRAGWFIGLAALCAFSYTPWVEAQEKSLPGNQLNLGLVPRPETAPGVSVIGEKQIGGMSYYAIHSGGATLYIPKLDHYSARDFEAAFCAPAREGQELESDRPMIGVEQKVTQSLSLYTELVQATYRSKCQGNPTTSAFNPVPELGIRYKPRGDGNELREYKAFVRPGTGVGVGMGF